MRKRIDKTTTVPDGTYYQFIDGQLVNSKTSWAFLDEPEEDIWDKSD